MIQDFNVEYENRNLGRHKSRNSVVDLKVERPNMQDDDDDEEIEIRHESYRNKDFVVRHIPEGVAGEDDEVR